MGAEHYGRERAETERAKAERIIALDLKRRRWTAAELKARLHRARSREGGIGRTLADGDDDDGGVDHGAVEDDAIAVHLREGFATWLWPIQQSCSGVKPTTVTTSTGVLVFTRIGEGGAEWEIVPNAPQD